MQNFWSKKIKMLVSKSKNFGVKRAKLLMQKKNGVKKGKFLVQKKIGVKKQKFWCKKGKKFSVKKLGILLCNAIPIFWCNFGETLRF